MRTHGLFTIILKPVKNIALGSVRPGFESWLCVTSAKWLDISEGQVSSS